MKSECGRYERPVLGGYEKDTGITYLYQPRCKQWDCPYCASVNKTQWALKISYGVEAYQGRGLDEWQFMTVTSHEKLKTKEATIGIWRNAWGKLQNRLRRQSSEMKYVLLPELHKDKRLHVHLIINTPVKKRWIKDNARKCGLGYMNETEKLVNAISAAWYLSKYLTKGVAVLDWPRKFRRVRTSNKWPELPDNDEYDKRALEWELIKYEYPIDGLEYLAGRLTDITGLKHEVLT